MVLHQKTYQAKSGLKSGKKMALQYDDLQIMASRDISEEEAERFEVECGFCSKIIAVRSLEAHIMALHSQEYA